MADRPDLSSVSADVLTYIETLEAELARLREEENAPGRGETSLEPSEPPTSVNVISISAGGIAKRTARHLYFRQRRGGMGVFDLDAPDEDRPAFLLMADESAGLILVSSQARAWRVPVGDIVQSEVRGRGESLLTRFPLRADERLALAVPDRPLEGGTFVILVSERGQVRRIAKQYLGVNLQPGTVLYDVKEGGAPAAACWGSGNEDLFIVTRQAQAIRFAERLVPVRGCLGLRVDPGDCVTGVTTTSADGGVFVLASDGKGTIRQMNGFVANKSPGAGGKTAMKADVLVGVVAVDERSDLFVISRLGKIIRFQAAEVPPKEGVVQGVNCMSLRADECVALTAAVIPTAA